LIYSDLLNRIKKNEKRDGDFITTILHRHPYSSLHNWGAYLMWC